MTDEEKIEFHAEISKNASTIVNGLMQSELSPLDSGFCLGSALKLISGVMAKLQAISQSDAEKSILEAFNAGYKNTQAQVIVIGASDSTH
jgi:hypothetical protein